MTPRIDVVVESELWERVPQAQPAIARAAAEVARTLVLREGDEVGVTLTDDAVMAELNGRWRNKAKATNVLSFPSPPPPVPGTPRFLGDIVLAFETIEREAREEDKAFEAHLSHLTVHGLLHLLGFDHEEDDDAEAMEALETRILAGLGIADPYEVGVERA
jgi:probable rRNA maturation factor